MKPDLPPSAFILPPLLSHLWLHEPDALAIARAEGELGLPVADPADLASAYTDVFLLNVYPYGTAFTDPSGELNGPEARQMAALYEAHGYQPPELNRVGAPDHLGLCLGFLAHMGRGDPGGRPMTRAGARSAPAPTSDTVASILPHLLAWAPVCCLAVEREPSAHPFYRVLATHTRETLLSQSAREARNPPSEIGLHPSREAFLPHPSEDEVRLHDIVHFFLAPAQCGAFLSRSRLGQMAKGLGLRLPFGSRFEVAEMLFQAAGEAEQIERLLAALEAEVGEWVRAYRVWVETYPAWRLNAEIWLARTADAMRTLAEMRQISSDPEGLRDLRGLGVKSV